jgi:hypothetical protein
MSDEAAEDVGGRVVCPPCAAELADKPWLPEGSAGAVVPLKTILWLVAAVAVIAAFVAGFYLGRRTAPRATAGGGGSPTSPP